MIIKFRQGIVSYPTTGGVQQFLVQSGNYLSLNATNGVIDVAFAHRSSDYLHTESVSVPNAWGPIPAPAVASDIWLYWDLNTLTAVRTFGFTTLQPISQSTSPLAPVVDQHWYDTSKSIMFVWTGSRWQEKIRVFAAAYNTTSRAFTSVSIFSDQQKFNGTQIGVQDGYPVLNPQQVSIPAGRIIVDNASRPILNQTNEFFTTEDDFFINGSPINTIRMEANILTAIPVEPVGAYQVVTFTNFGKVKLAEYADVQDNAIAIAVQSVASGDVGSFVVQGIITNPLWNWPAVGAELWVSTAGLLVTDDPHTTDAVNNKIGKPPVGRVIAPSSIIFDQGLGGKGDKGDSALDEAGGAGAATMTKLGKVKLTVAPADPGSPYVVETSDPRLNDARTPLLHHHPASEIDPDTYGNNINGTLQTTLQNLENAKVDKAGSTMTGPLSLSGLPTADAHAASKRYVDKSLTDASGTPGGFATLGSNGKIPDSQIPQYSITDTFVVGSAIEMGNLNAQTGDIAIRTDINATYILKGQQPSVLSDWEELLTRPDGVVRVDVQPAPGQTGITTSGGPVTSEGVIHISLANNLAGVEALTSTGVIQRAHDIQSGVTTWSASSVDLTPLAGNVSGVLSVVNGGTGLSFANGYLKGSGSTISTSATIPAADILGTVASASSVDWTGVMNKPVTISGYGITDAYSKLDTYSKVETNALTWSWASIVDRPVVYTQTEVNNMLLTKANNATTLVGYGITDAQPLDADLSSIAGLSGTAGILKKTATNTWVLDTSAYTTGNDTIVFSGDATGTGTTAIALTLKSVGTAGEYTKVTTDANGRVVSGAPLAATDIPNISWSKITSDKPTSVAGYGIADVYTKTETNALTWSWSVIGGRPTSVAGYGITDAYTKTETNALTWNWSSIIAKPTTVSGYGIADVYTKTQTDALTWNWSAIGSRPTTLAGYGITDASLSTHNHDATYVKTVDIGTTVASLDFTGKIPTDELPPAATGRVFQISTEAAMLSLPAYPGDLAVRTDIQTTYALAFTDASNLANWRTILAPSGPAGTITSVSVDSSSPGLVASGSPITTSGTITLSLSGELDAVNGVSTVGYVKRTAPNTWSAVSTIPLSDVSGTVPISQGGTGATTSPEALTNLGAPSTSGTGATGTWGINVTGNAGTVTNGLYNTSTYSDPAWITSLSPSKVVGTWAGSNNINTLADSVNFGGLLRMVNSVTTISSTTPTVVHVFNTADTSGGKYLIMVSCASPNTVAIVELFVSVDSAGDVYFAQTATGSNTTVFSATNTAGVVSILATASTNNPTIYKYSATLFAA